MEDHDADGDWEGTFEQCAHCGARLTVNEWYPIVTETDERGELEVHSFCDDACKEAWTE